MLGLLFPGLRNPGSCLAGDCCATAQPRRLCQSHAIGITVFLFPQMFALFFHRFVDARLWLSKYTSFLVLFGIVSKFVKWVKIGGYLPLFTVELRSKNSVLRFAECINFRHFAKQSRLAELTSLNANSPVV